MSNSRCRRIPRPIVTGTAANATVSQLEGRGRAFQDPRSATTEAFRIRRAIQDYVLADPAREPRILADLAEACEAIGVKVPAGPDGVDALAGLLDGPWDRPSVPYAATVQVLRAAGPALAFADGAIGLDFSGIRTPRDRRFAPASGR